MATFGTFSSGSVLTAAELNSGGAWTTFTPTLSNVTLGTGGTNTGQYSIFNKTLLMRGKFVLGTGGSVTGVIAVSCPVSTLALSPTMQFQLNGQVLYTDSGVASYTGPALQLTSSLIAFYVNNTAGTYASAVTSSGTVPFTFGVNDYVEYALTLQVA